LDNTGLSLDAWMMLVFLWICGALGLSKDSLDAWFFQMMLGCCWSFFGFWMLGFFLGFGDLVSIN
jgi:hypothetical protein